MTTQPKAKPADDEADETALNQDSYGMDWSTVSGFGANPIAEADDADDAQPFGQPEDAAESAPSTTSEGTGPKADAPTAENAPAAETQSGQAPEDENDPKVLKARIAALDARIAKAENDNRAKDQLIKSRNDRDTALSGQIVAQVARLMGKQADLVGDEEASQEAKTLETQALQSIQREAYEEQIEDALDFLAEQNKGLDDKPLFADLNKADELKAAREAAAAAHTKGDAAGVLRASLQVANAYIAKLRTQAKAIPVDLEKAKKDSYDEGFAAAVKRYRINDMGGGRQAPSRGNSTDFDSAKPGDFFSAALEKRGGIPVNN